MEWFLSANCGKTNFVAIENIWEDLHVILKSLVFFSRGFRYKTALKFDDTRD